MQVLPYHKAEREAVFAFIRTVYPKERSALQIHQWDWKYRERPPDNGPAPHLLLMKDRRKIIGMYGAVFLRVSVLGKIRWVANYCDLIIHPDYRGRGLSRRLIRAMYEEYPTGFGWQTRAGLRATQSLSVSRSACIVPLVKVVDFKCLLQYGGVRQHVTRCSRHLTASMRRTARHIREISDREGVTVARKDTFDRGVNNLWQRARRDYPVIGVRDRNYLDWRFLCRPDVRYKLHEASKGNETVGYLVLRSHVRAGIKIGYLVDFLVDGGDPGIIGALFHKAVASLRSEGVGIILCRATSHSYRRILKRLGFFPLIWMRRTQFHPRDASNDPKIRIFRDPRNWFLTMGDGDFEMAF
jgi:GNAT superfamily N-acetyltransferase